jgi:hypothetical protein
MRSWRPLLRNTEEGSFSESDGCTFLGKCCWEYILAVWLRSHPFTLSIVVIRVIFFF